MLSIELYILQMILNYVGKRTLSNTGENSLADSKHISSSFIITSICKITKNKPSQSI